MASPSIPLARSCCTVFFGRAGARAPARHGAELRIADHLDGQRVRLFACDSEIRQLDRPPGVAVGEVSALDQGIAVAVDLLRQSKRCAQRGGQDPQSA